MCDWRSGVDVFEWGPLVRKGYATRRTLQAGACASTNPAKPQPLVQQR